MGRTSLERRIQTCIPTVLARLCNARDAICAPHGRKVFACSALCAPHNRTPCPLSHGKERGVV